MQHVMHGARTIIHVSLLFLHVCMMYVYICTQCMTLQVHQCMCFDAYTHGVVDICLETAGKCNIHVSCCLQKKLAVPNVSKDVEQADLSNSDDTSNDISRLTETDSDQSAVPFNYTMKPMDMDLEQAQMPENYASAPTVLQPHSTLTYSLLPPLRSSRIPKEPPTSTAGLIPPLQSSKEIREPPALADPLPPIQAPGDPYAATGSSRSSQISWHPSTFAPTGQPHQQAPSGADLGSQEGHGVKPASSSDEASDGYDRQHDFTDGVAGMDETEGVEQAGGEPVRLVHAAIIHPHQIQICKRPNGNDWVLGAGSFGMVS